LYLKYDLNPIFKTIQKQNNVSLGVRFDFNYSFFLPVKKTPDKNLEKGFAI
jgi:hypothetical protein